MYYNKKYNENLFEFCTHLLNLTAQNISKMKKKKIETDHFSKDFLLLKIKYCYSCLLCTYIVLLYIQTASSIAAVNFFSYFIK